MLSDIGSKPMGSVILLHACAHNPTGVDPSNEQWKEICSVIKKRNHIAFFDCAYQGYATGDLDQDAFAVRLFEKEGVEMFIAQSFSKNMGLYGERIGCLSVISNTGNKNIIESQLAKICRSSYSNPPVHGAQIVSAILGNPINTKTWINELMQMSSRISHMRDLLFKYLTENNTPGK